MSAELSLTNKSADELLGSLLVLARSINHVLEKRTVQESTRLPLSVSKVQLLRLLEQGGEQNSTQIARYLCVSKPAVTQMLDALVRAKLVVRKTQVRDRREVGLNLTADGKKTIRDIRRKQKQFARSAVREFADRDVQQMIAMMKRTAAGLVSADRSFDDFCLQCTAHGDGVCILAVGKAGCPFTQHAEQAPNSTPKPPKPKRSRS